MRRRDAVVKMMQKGNAMTDVIIAHHPGEFVATLPGETAVGRLTYVMRGSVLIANHTLVPPAIGGRGVAAKLVQALIAHARDNGLTIDPQCSYVDAAFRRHPEWAPLHA
jgi:hypothetical protein